MIYNEELDLYYDPIEGRLWRIHEKPIHRYNVSSGRDQSTETTRDGVTKSTTHYIWKIMTGEWPRPGYMIDHIDGDPTNNTWENYREVTPTQNAINRQQAGRIKDGCDHLVTGVNKTKSGFEVRMRVEGKHQYFGHFVLAAEANAFALTKRKELYGDFERKGTETIKRDE